MKLIWRHYNVYHGFGCHRRRGPNSILSGVMLNTWDYKVIGRQGHRNYRINHSLDVNPSVECLTWIADGLYMPKYQTMLIAIPLKFCKNVYFIFIDCWWCAMWHLINEGVFLRNSKVRIIWATGTGICYPIFWSTGYSQYNMYIYIYILAEDAVTPVTLVRVGTKCHVIPT